MSSTSPVRTGNRHQAPDECRAAPGRRSRLGRLGAMLGSPLALVRRRGELHVVLVDRRRPSPNDPAVALALLRDELRDRLLAHENAHTAQVMRHLVFVHDELGNKGWDGVAAFPARVLRKALTQAEMLASEEATSAMTQMVDRLRACQVAAEVREERAPGPRVAAVDDSTEVSEASHEDFALMERAWVDTVSSTFTLRPVRA